MRELGRFLSGFDPNNTFSGLRRVATQDGMCCWTSDDNVQHIEAGEEFKAGDAGDDNGTAGESAEKESGTAVLGAAVVGVAEVVDQRTAAVDISKNGDGLSSALTVVASSFKEPGGQSTGKSTDLTTVHTTNTTTDSPSAADTELIRQLTEKLAEQNKTIANLLQSNNLQAAINKQQSETIHMLTVCVTGDVKLTVQEAAQTSANGVGSAKKGWFASKQSGNK